MATLGQVFESLVEKIKNFDIYRAAGEMGSGAVKIPLEGKYDALGKTKWIQELKQAGPGKKFSSVAGLLLLSAVFSQAIREDSTFRLAVKRLLEDVGPEIGKRIVNGDDKPIVADSDKYVSLVDQPTEKSILKMLCGQKADVFAGFWIWYDQPEQEKRRMILAQMKEHGFTEGEIQNIPSLDPDKLRQLFEDFQGPKIEKLKKEILPLTKSVLERRLDRYIEKNRKKEEADG